mgnify:CR=1 FL=1
MLNIDFLEYLVEFAKTENLSRASEQLHISQSALTRAMQKVEDYVGVKIFNRTKNKLSLNDTGKELVKNAELVIQSENEMIEKTLAFYNSNFGINIGVVAPGPMIKYGNLLFSSFPNKSISSKIESEESLLRDLQNGIYDIVFTTKQIENDNTISKFAFTEELYVAVPKHHFVAGMNNGVYFKDIDGQSFLVANELGIWENIVKDNMPRSKFFSQDFENLGEIVNSSTIPSFATNITIPNQETDRVFIPILNSEAKVDFYISYKKENKNKVKDFMKFF